MVAVLNSTHASFTRRELGGLTELRKNGYKLVEVMVSPVCTLRGRLLSSIELPNDTRIMCIRRNGEDAILDCEDTFLRGGDRIMLLTKDEEIVRRFFMF